MTAASIGGMLFMLVYLAFERGWLSLWQLLAGKPLPDGRLPHPLTRDYMYAAS